MSTVIIDPKEPYVMPIWKQYGAMTHEEWGNGMRLLVPEHMHAGFFRWVEFGDPDRLGAFLRALLKNDLISAVTRADTINGKALNDWVIFLLNFAPEGCYGSERAVRSWQGLAARNLHENEH